MKKKIAKSIRSLKTINAGRKTPVVNSIRERAQYLKTTKGNTPAVQKAVRKYETAADILTKLPERKPKLSKEERSTKIVNNVMAGKTRSHLPFEHRSIYRGAHVKALKKLRPNYVKPVTSTKLQGRGTTERKVKAIRKLRERKYNKFYKSIPPQPDIVGGYQPSKQEKLRNAKHRKDLKDIQKRRYGQRDKVAKTLKANRNLYKGLEGL